MPKTIADCIGRVDAAIMRTDCCLRLPGTPVAVLAYLVVVRIKCMANILMIDDEPLLLGLISNTLRLDGHKTIALSDPLDALDYQREGQSPIDLLLTDIDMKPISGFELVNRLTKAGFDGPVLFTSGYPALSGAIANSLGQRSILEKPFTAPQLRAAVRGTLSRSKPKFTHAA
jgi:DNA-binding NtrC family response regulator